jgi:nucleoid DNA-binding protein
MATRKELIRAFRDRAGLTVRESALCADTLVQWLGETLTSGKSIELRGFGSFEIRQMPERKISSVFSSKSVIPARSRIFFRPCERLRKAVWNRKT